MHSKLHALTATILGSLFAAGPVAAQTVDADRYQQQQREQAQREQLREQQAQQNLQAQPAPNGARVATRTGPTCPVGCVPALTPEQRAARRARISRAEARRREEEAFAQQQADAQRLAEQERLDRERSEQDRIRADRERMERERLDQETAERERLERERAAMEDQEVAVAPQPVESRGGGPEGFRPRLVLGLDTQIAGYSGGMADAVHPGPLVGLRGGVALGSWFELEGRGFYMYNNGVRSDLGQGVGQNTWATAGVVRLNIPLPIIHPYVFSGIGVLATTRSQIDVDNTANGFNTSLVNNTAGFVPMGGGINFALHENWQLGAEGTYNYVWDHNGFSTNPAHDVNGFWQTGLVLRYLM